MIDHRQQRTTEKLRRKSLSAAVAMMAACGPVPGLSQGPQLEEVLVTAQKREQSLQDEPISVSVTTGERLEEFSINVLEEMSASIPNVTITENATQDSVTIRGIGSGANQGFEQSVGTFVDGVYFGRGRSSRSPFLDVERVEVLKGPQGVLFGKNTIAGALNITTRKPTQEFEGSLEAQYFEGDDSYGATGVLSGPLTDRIAARGVFKYNQSNGCIDNRAIGADDPEIEEQLLRLALSFDARWQITEHWMLYGAWGYWMRAVSRASDVLRIRFQSHHRRWRWQTAIRAVRR